MKIQLEETISAQTKISGIEVYSLMKFKDWHIVHFDPGNSEPPYYFFSEEPTAGSTPVAVFGGGGPIFDAGSIVSWVKDNAQGIPDNVAECFAWKLILSPE